MWRALQKTGANLANHVGRAGWALSVKEKRREAKMPRERKRRWAVVVYMADGAAIVDGWHTRERAIEYLHDYRTNPQFAGYLDGMAIVMLDDAAWPYKTR
jgi:hypothetical protein